MAKFKKNTRGFDFSLETLAKIAAIIFFLGIILWVIWYLTLGSKDEPGIMKKIWGALAGSAKSDPRCDSYSQIRSEQNLTDLIILVSTGECGGDTTEGAFKFNITQTSTIKYHTDTTSDKFCGTHTYEVWGLNRTITFGDIEAVEADNCGYSEDWDTSIFGWLDESQACVSSEHRDLVIVTPEYRMGSGCPSYLPTPTSYGCIDETASFLSPSSHLSWFGLDPVYHSASTPPINRKGTWAIKRAGEDTVICLMGTE